MKTPAAFLSIVVAMTLAVPAAHTQPKGQGLMYCANRMIRTWDDVKGLKIGAETATATAWAKRYFERFGGTVIRVGPERSLPLLERNSIDGFAYFGQNYRHRASVNKACDDVCMGREYFRVARYCYLIWPTKVCKAGDARYQPCK